MFSAGWEIELIWQLAIWGRGEPASQSFWDKLHLLEGNIHLMK